MSWLEIDAGNTRVKWRICSRPGSAESVSVQNYGAVVATENDSTVSQVVNQIAESAEWIEHVLVSNVRGLEFENRLVSLSQLTFGVFPKFATSNHSCCGVTNGYSVPSRLGVDRWLAIIAGYSISKSSCFVVDCGTTITIDLVDRNGMHKGGFIVPGLQLMKDSLARKSKVLDIDGSGMLSLDFGHSTETAINGGIHAMVVGLIERIMRLHCDQDEKTQLIFTGGDALVISSLVPSYSRVEPFLVLDGLQLYFDT